MRTPSLDYAHSIGLHDLQVVCTRCGARSIVPLAAIDLPGQTPLELIPTLRPLACGDCSGDCEVDLEGMGFLPKA